MRQKNRKPQFNLYMRKLYEAIPVYPEFILIRKPHNLSAYAPLCEEDGNHISFISQEAKNMFLSTGI